MQMPAPGKDPAPAKAPGKQNAEAATQWPGAVIDRPARAKAVRPDTTTIKPLL